MLLHNPKTGVTWEVVHKDTIARCLAEGHRPVIEGATDAAGNILGAVPTPPETSEEREQRELRELQALLERNAAARAWVQSLTPKDTSNAKASEQPATKGR